MRATTCGTVVSSLCVGLLGAQTGAAAQAVASDGPAALEEVVVTAQKRSEDLQKASLSVSVVQAEDLAATGIRNAIDLQDIVPAVRFVAADQWTVQIRGLGTINNNPGVDSAVGYAEDGVYLAHPSALTPVLFDLKRVEVLLGPQGTLYGRNTNGGVMQFVTNDPSTQAMAGRVRVGVGNFSAVTSEVMLNVPLSDEWAFRIAGGSDKHGPYVDDGTNNVDSIAGRAKLLYAPNEDWRAQLSLSAARRHSVGQGYGGQCPPGNAAPGCAGTTWRPWSGFTPRPTGMFNNYNVQGGSLDINGDLGGTTLTSVTAYRRYSLDSTTAPAAAPSGNPNFIYRHPEKDRNVSQEIRLASDADSDMKWVLGAYYSRESQSSFVQFEYYNTVLQAFFGVPPNYFQKLDTPKLINRSIAGFADLSLPVSERVRLRAGFRYTDEKKEALGTIDFFVGGVSIAPTQRNPASDSFSKLTWKAGIDFDLTPSNLLFATVSTGFKSGGVNNLPASSGILTYKPEEITAYEIGTKNRFANDRVQVNASLFHYDYKNYQTFTFYQPTGGPLAGSTLFPTLNSQTATFEGGELQAEFALTARDRLGLAVNVLNNQFDRFVIALPFAPVADLSGTDVPLAPSTAVTVSYEHVFPLVNGSLLTTGASAYYSASYLSTGNQGATTFNALYTQKARTKLNATATWKSAQGDWTVTAFGRNLSNEATINTVAGGYPVLDNLTSVNAMIDPPRTFGISIQKEF